MIVELDPGTQERRARLPDRRDRPGLADAAERQPRRVPRRARRRHARLPPAAGRRRRPGPQGNGRKPLGDAEALRADGARRRPDHAAARRAAEAHPPRDPQLPPAGRGAGRQGRRSSRSSSTPPTRCSAHSRTPRRACARRCASCPAALSRHERRAREVRRALATVLGPTLAELHAGRRGPRPRRSRRFQSFAKETTPMIQDQLRPVHGRRRSRRRRRCSRPPATSRRSRRSWPTASTS